MTYTLPDGAVVDLDHPLSDVFGTEWRWTGRRDDAGQPLMTSTRLRKTPPAPVDDVHEMFGPLVELPPAPAQQPPRRVLPPLPRRTRHAAAGGWIR